MTKKLFILFLLCGIACGQFNGIKPPLGTQLDLGHSLTKGLVGAWFNQEAAPALGTLFDLSGNGNNGTLMVGTFSVPGLFGNGLDVNGSTDWIDIPDGVFLGTDSFSFVVWAIARSVIGGNNFNMLLATNTSPQRIFLGVKSTNFAFRKDDTGDVATSGFLLDTWYQHVLTFDVNTGVLNHYIDGVFIKTATESTINTSNPTQLNIGSFSEGGSNFWDGIIDHVLIYNRVLSAGEVASLYRDPFQIFEQPDIALIAAAGAAPPAEEHTQVMIFFTELTPYWLPLLLIGSLALASKYGRNAA